MDNKNYDILVKNIKRLMKDKNINQATLIRETQIAQPQMSKALNPNVKNQFTFEQIITIADYFNVSIDFLVGRTPTTESDDQLSNKEICKMLMQLIDRKIVSCVAVTPTETHFDKMPPQMPCDKPYTPKKGSVSYKAFYFSKYYQFDDRITGEMADYFDDCFCYGNTIAKNDEINNFLEYYFKFTELFQNEEITQEIYNLAINDRLDKLSK